jgi:hypothetical protein
MEAIPQLYFVGCFLKSKKNVGIIFPKVHELFVQASTINIYR